MSAEDNLSPQQFKEIPASELQVGHRLDSGRKDRVAKVMERNGKILAQTKRLGARSPGVREWDKDETVRVWEGKRERRSE